MPDIHLSKIDETDMQVHCEVSTFLDLQEHFTFQVPGFQYMQKFRQGNWNGKIKLLNASTCTLNIGLLAQTIAYATASGYSITIDPRLYPPVADAALIPDFLDTLVLTDKAGDSITPRDFQLTALEECVTSGRRAIISPTASGKSLIVYLLSRFYLNKYASERTWTADEPTCGRILIVVPTITLVSQMATDFAEYSQRDPGFNADVAIHQIQGGTDKNGPRSADVFISTWQSIYKLPPSYFEQFNVIIGDECHQYKADAIKGIVEKARSTPHRFGLTGTVTADESQCHRLIIEGLFGPCVRVATTRELMDRGDIAGIDISIVSLIYNKADLDNVSVKEYDDELKFLYRHAARNEKIVEDALSISGNTLVLYVQVKHGEALFELAQKRANGRKKVFLIHGQHDGEERDELKAIMERETDVVAFVSAGTFSTGVSIKRINNLSFAAPFKSLIRVLQSIGRGLRLHKSKTNLNLIDYVDVFPKGKNTAIKHGADRVKIYNREQFEYTMFEHPLPPHKGHIQNVQSRTDGTENSVFVP